MSIASLLLSTWRRDFLANRAWEFQVAPLMSPVNCICAGGRITSVWCVAARCGGGGAANEGILGGKIVGGGWVGVSGLGGEGV
jgi:hypothetical protein